MFGTGYLLGYFIAHKKWFLFFMTCVRNFLISMGQIISNRLKMPMFPTISTIRCDGLNCSIFLISISTRVIQKKERKEMAIYLFMVVV